MKFPLSNSTKLAAAAGVLLATDHTAKVNALGPDGKCRILSLRGGGVHGAWEVGVLQALIDNMPAEELMYDYVGGVSIGAINASIIASFAPGQEREAIDTMSKVYEGRATAELIDFYKPKVLAPFRQTSMAQNQKLKDIVAETLGDRPFQRCLSILSCDLNTGQVVVFDETMSNEERVDGIISSTAISFAFPPEFIDDMMLVDGSLFSTVSVGDPIERCRQEVDSDKDIIVDVLLCYEEQYDFGDWNTDDVRWKTAIDMYKRRKAISHYYYYEEDILRMTRGYHDVQFRMVITPSTPLTQKGVVPINATAEDIALENEQGYKDGLIAF